MYNCFRQSSIKKKIKWISQYSSQKKVFKNVIVTGLKKEIPRNQLLCAKEKTQEPLKP